MRTVRALLLVTLLLAQAATVLALDTSVPAVQPGGPPAVTGRGVVIAVLDTGVDESHVTFRDAYRGGVDVSHPPVTGDVTEFPCSNPDDADGHGTHVAAIALGRGGPEGFNRGVAPGAALVDVKVTGSLGGFSLSGLERGLEWVRAYNRGETACRLEGVSRIHVVSISLGSVGPGSAQDDASRLANALAREGTVVVASAGNCGPEPSVVGCTERGNHTISSPAIATGVLAVAAFDHRGTSDPSDDEIAPYSSRGPAGGSLKPDLAAPGTAIRSARAASVPGEYAQGWTAKTGTSMAAPHVAGAAALLLQANPSLGAEDVRRILRQTARDHAATGWDAAWGYGALDVTAALAAAHPVENRPPDPAFAARCKSLTCTFDARMTMDPEGDRLEYWWDFGDGNESSEGPVVEHTYLAPGAHTITLKVQDTRGHVAEMRRVLQVQGNAPPVDRAEDAHPVPVIDAPEGPVTPAAWVVLSANRSRDDGQLVAYRWDLDRDGRTDMQGAWIRTQFHRVGEHPIFLTVVDNSGRAASAEARIRVEPADRPEPATEPSAPRVVFLEPAPGDAVTNPVSLRWRLDGAAPQGDFQVIVDGTPAFQTPETAATLQVPLGERLLTVRVHDEAGRVVEESIRVRVTPPARTVDAPVPASVEATRNADSEPEEPERRAQPDDKPATPSRQAAADAQDPRGVPALGVLLGASTLGLAALLRRRRG